MRGAEADGGPLEGVLGAPPDREPPGAGARGLPFVLVLGMHRSGTSALSGLLCASGAWAGRAADLMPADVHNSVGYFERVDTALRLERLLVELGGTWKCPPWEALEDADPRRIADLLRELVAEVATDAPPDAVPLLKDPRLSLLAAAVPTVLGDGGDVVVCVRHPVEVARSLQESQGLPLDVGLALWEGYNVALCRGLAGRPVDVVDYADLLASPGGGRPLAERLLRRQAQEGGPPRAEPQHLRGELRRQRASEADEVDWLTVAQQRLWQALAESARAGRPTELPIGLASPGSRARLLQHRVTEELSTCVSALQEERDQVRVELAATSTQVASAATAASVAQQRAAGADAAARTATSRALAVETELAAVRRRLAVAVARVNREAGKADGLQLGLVEALGEVERAVRQRTSLETSLHEARAREADLLASVGVLEGRVVSLASAAQELPRRARERDEAAQERDAALETLAGVLHSRAWRIGRFVTLPWRRVRGRRGPRPGLRTTAVPWVQPVLPASTPRQ